MPKSVKQTRIDNAKNKAPSVPGYTCPSIDYAQEIIDQIANRGDEWAMKQSDVVRDVLEYVRASNDELRESSKYWYKKYKEAA